MTTRSERNNKNHNRRSRAATPRAARSAATTATPRASNQRMGREEAVEGEAVPTIQFTFGISMERVEIVKQMLSNTFLDDNRLTTALNARRHDLLNTEMGDLLRQKLHSLVEEKASTDSKLLGDIDQQIHDVLSWAVERARPPKKIKGKRSYMADLCLVMLRLSGQDIDLLSHLGYYLLRSVIRSENGVYKFKALFDVLCLEYNNDGDGDGDGAKQEAQATLLEKLLGIDALLASEWVRKYCRFPDLDPQPGICVDLPAEFKPIKEKVMLLWKLEETTTVEEDALSDEHLYRFFLPVPAAHGADEDKKLDRNKQFNPELFDVLLKSVSSLMDDGSLRNQYVIAERLDEHFPGHRFPERHLQYVQQLVGDGVSVRSGATTPTTAASSEESSDADAALSGESEQYRRTAVSSEKSEQNNANVGSSDESNQNEASLMAQEDKLFQMAKCSDEQLFGFEAQAYNTILRPRLRKVMGEDIIAGAVGVPETEYGKAQAGLRFKLDHFVFIDYFGHGSFSMAFLARLKTLKDAVVVIRLELVKTSRLPHDVSLPLRLHGSVAMHENVVSVYGYILEKTKDKDVFLFGQILERCQARDLEQVREEFLKSNPTDDAKLRWINGHSGHGSFGQLLAGVEAIHKRGFFHRDLKPENILLSHEDGTLKLADFGLARLDDNTKKTLGRGSKSYMAPEVMAGHDYDKSCDVWSTGAVLYEFIMGALWQEVGNDNLATALAQLPSGEKWNPLVDLCKKMLVQEPKERISISKAKELYDEYAANSGPP